MDPLENILNPLEIMRCNRHVYMTVDSYIAELTKRYLALADNPDICTDNKEEYRCSFYRLCKEELFSEVKMKKLIDAVENTAMWWIDIWINQMETNAFECRVDIETLADGEYTIFRAMYDIEYYLLDNVYRVTRTPAYNENVVPAGDRIRGNWFLDKLKTILCLDSRSATRYNDDGTITEIY